MNAENNADLQRGEPLVSEAYRALAVEKAPPNRDRAVLAEAAAAAGRGRPARGFRGWLRPLAFVATAFLSLAIVLDLTRTSDEAVPVPAVNETGGIAPRQDTVRFSSEPRPDSNAPVADAERREAAFSAGSDLAAAAEDASGRLRQVDVQSRQLISGDASADLPAAAPAASGAPAERASALRDTGRYCSDEQASSAQTWWACIDDLRRAGDIEAADAEQALLQTAFPDFGQPE